MATSTAMRWLRLRPLPRAAWLTVAAVFVLGILVGGLASSAVRLPVERDLSGYHGGALDVISMILAHNVPAALLLYSGVLTLGFSTAASLFVTSVYVGVIVSSAISAMGFAQAGVVMAPYALLEVGGLLCAAAAGLAPVSAGLSASSGCRGDAGWARLAAAPSAYLHQAAGTVAWLAVSLTAIVAGAVIEAWGIVS